MKRRSFAVSGLGLVAASCVRGPALAHVLSRSQTSPTSVAVRRRLPPGSIPGGCSTHRRRSPLAGYTLADALSGKFGR